MKKDKVLADGAEVERIRQARRSIEREFKTVDALMAHWIELDKKHRAELAARKKNRRSANEQR